MESARVMIKQLSERDPGLDAGDLVLIRNWYQEIEPTRPNP